MQFYCLIQHIYAQLFGRYKPGLVMVHKIECGRTVPHVI